MTPLQIEMLLHVYARKSPIPNGEYPAQVDAMNGFILDGLVELELVDGLPVLAARGEAYVRFLMQMPLPVANWSIPGPWAPSHPNERAALERMMDLAANRGRNAQSS